MRLSASIRDVMSWIRGVGLAQERGKGRMGVRGRKYCEQQLRGRKGQRVRVLSYSKTEANDEKKS